MYEIVSIKDRIRVPPHLFKDKLEDSVEGAIKDGYEGIFDRKIGVLLLNISVNSIGEGVILPGDGAVYYDAEFDMLVWKPELQEIVKGFVSEITEFGAFIRIGPVEGMVHLSQVMDDFVSYSKSGSLQGRESNSVIKVGDQVVARIIAISFKTSETPKIGLTMRQKGLGKPEWWVEKTKKKGDEK